MNRHPELSIRAPESVTAASSKVSEKDIRNWFRSVYNYLEDNKLTDILNDPTRILNGDETGFSLNPVPKQVIGTVGNKNVSFVETTCSKLNVTVMFSFSADGFVIPPDVILPRKRFSRDILRSFPGDWGLGSSENGWMDTSNFIMYIKKILYPTLVKRGTKFPIIYFVDGHSSHTALEAADTCNKLGIILIALYPNATRILQPADVAIFKPLKSNWSKTLDSWRSNHISEKMTLTTFGPLLEKTMDESFKKSTIINGFSACGLFPYNPDAVDFSKCLAKGTGDPEISLMINDGEDGGTNDFYSTLPTGDESLTEESSVFCTETLSMHEMFMETKIAASSSLNCNVTLETHVLVPQSVLNQAVEMLGQSKISLYLSEQSDNMSQEDKVLSYIYRNILSLRKSDELSSIATINALYDTTDTCNETTEEPVISSEIVEESYMDTSIENNQTIVGKASEIEMTSDTIEFNDTTVTCNETIGMYIHQFSRLTSYSNPY